MKRNRPQPRREGWAVYLRTSNADAQNPDNSQKRQRTIIYDNLIKSSGIPIIQEYIDNLSGKTPDRPSYQQMLQDARKGSFSHVAVENAERFGRNDAEALMAIDALHAQGVAVRFGDYPDLDPIDPDDRVIVSLSFTLARRESMILGKRTSGGQNAKLQRGGWAWKAPDGYLNCEYRTGTHEKTQAGRYTRWVEKDPERAHIWREAWDLLLTNQYTLSDICRILHERGYTFRSGRPFVATDEDGNATSSRNALSRAFRNWFYAGWIVNPQRNIRPKTLRGEWEPIVTTDEFERGLAILHSRTKRHLNKTRRHTYLLQGIVYMQREGYKRLLKLVCSKANSSRPGGGTAYYMTANRKLNVRCPVVDAQVPALLERIQVNPERIPLIQAHYRRDLAAQFESRMPEDTDRIQQALEALDREEERALRLYAKGKISETTWDALWQEWQERRFSLNQNLRQLAEEEQRHVRNLDHALDIISEIAILYNKLSLNNQARLLSLIVEKLVVDEAGNVLRVELHSPFSYLSKVDGWIEQQNQPTEASNDPDVETEKASHLTGSLHLPECSTDVPLCDPNVTYLEQDAISPELQAFLNNLSFPQKSELERLSTICGFGFKGD